MAKTSKREVCSDEAYSSEEEEQVNDQANVEEDDAELEAVDRSADSDEEDVAPEEAPVSDDEVVPVEDDADEVGPRFSLFLFDSHSLVRCDFGDGCAWNSEFNLSTIGVS